MTRTSGSRKRRTEEDQGATVESRPTPPAQVVDQTMSTEEVSRILEARARTLAQVTLEEGKEATAQVITFALGDEVYAIEALHVENIYPLEGLTPVPCTPDFVVGVVNLRGRIYSVIDLHRFMCLASVAIDDSSQIIAIHVAGIEVGLLSNNVLSVGPLTLSRLEPALPTTTRVAAEYTRGVTSELVVLLDLEALLRDPRMVVHEEI